MTSKDNMVATLLQVIGGLIIAAYSCQAAILFFEYERSTAFDIFLQGIVLGMLLAGFGEVIKLMQGLFNQREPERPLAGAEGEKKRIVVRRTDESELPLESRNRVVDFYTKKGVVVDDIEATPFEGYVLVHYGAHKDLVDMRGWDMVILTREQIVAHEELKSLLE